MSNKLGRNELCWCGSGRKYKYCHLNRSSERRLPIKAIIKKTLDSARYQTCLHPEASPDLCGKISSAHTLQRARVLKSIESLDHHILTFYPLRIEEGEPKVHKRGWRQASTFDAFCTKHDSSTFAPLEAEPFTGSKEQIFLIGYRAVCWELYQKIRALRAMPTMRELLDRGAPPEIQQDIQTFLRTGDMGLRKGYDEAKKRKTSMDDAYLRKDYENYETFRIKVAGTLDIAATGGITPSLTLGGAKLQTLHDISATLEWLTFGVDIDSEGFSIVFIWEKKSNVPRNYLEDLKGFSNEKLAAFLPQFFFGHCENTYFSESWWRNCENVNQSLVKRLVANVNPYYCPPEYDLSRRLTSWTIVTREYS